MDATAIHHWRRPPSWRVIAVGFGVGLVTAALVGVYTAFVPPGDLRMRLPLWALPLLSLVMVPLEEWLFRGVVLRWTWYLMGQFPAFVISASAFAAVHGDWPRFPVRFAIGVVLGMLYVRTRSLWPGIVAHYVHNVALVALALLGAK